MKLIQCPECEGTGYVTYEGDTLDCTLCSEQGHIFACTLEERKRIDSTIENYVSEIRRIKNYVRQWQGLLSGNLMIDKDNNLVEKREPQLGDSIYIRFYY